MNKKSDICTFCDTARAALAWALLIFGAIASMLPTIGWVSASNDWDRAAAYFIGFGLLIFAVDYIYLRVKFLVAGR